MSDPRAAWTAYWASQRAAPGCVPAGGQRLTHTLAALWAGVSAPLPQRAELLDIATGDGAVIRHLRANRPDLRCVGVDYAETLPSAAPGVDLMPGVQAEQLPFDAGRFNCVTSQFGLEYCNLADALAEIARVLDPAGSAWIVSHAAGSRVVAHNARRLTRLCEGRSRLSIVTAALAAGRGGENLLNTVAAAQDGLADRHDPAWQMLESVRRAAPAHTPSAINAMIERIIAQSAHEQRRIEALLAAAGVGSDDQLWRDSARAAGLELAAGDPLHEAPGEPAFAMLRRYTRT